MTKAAVLAQLRAALSVLEGRPAQLEETQNIDSWRIGDISLAVTGVHEIAPAAPSHWSKAAGLAVRLLLCLPAARRGKPLLWVQTTGTLRERGRLSAVRLSQLGLDIDRLILLDVDKPRDALWALDEALRCRALAGVVAAGVDIGFTASRRLSLAAASSHVPLLHVPEHMPATSAALTRWQVAPLPSGVDPWASKAVGPPRWRLTLTRARQPISCALPATFDLEWCHEALRFNLVSPLAYQPVAAPAAHAA